MKRVPELDGLRGIAIILILLFHFGPVKGPLGFLAPFFQTGWIGVDLFFVLSGYLITGILIDARGRAGAYKNFIIRRTLRIFPLYYAVLLLDGYLSETGKVDWWYFAYLSNVKVFLDNQWPRIPTLIPLWSLSVEEQFYLLFPLLVLFFSRQSLGRLLVGALVGALVIRVGLVLAMPSNITGTYTLMPCRMDSLALGGLIAVARRDYPELLSRRWIGWLAGLCGVVFLIICMTVSTGPWSVPMRTFGFTALDVAFAGVLVLVLRGRVASLIAFCRLRFLVWIGTVSYGIYLLHILVAVIARRHESSVEPGGSVDFVVSVLVSLMAAWISWVVFEAPLLRLKDRLAPGQAGRGRPARTGGSAPQRQ
jgi:peptidoglycan/LPS O-acetylase OafA/YrhL